MNEQGNHADNNEEAVERQRAEIWQLANEAGSDLHQLDKPELTYSVANFLTANSLFNLIMLDDQGASAALSEEERQLLQRATQLPFTAEEHKTLVDHMRESRETEHSRQSVVWYEAGRPDDILLTDRWRRWLDEQFDPEILDPELKDGLAMLEALDSLTSALGHSFNV